MNCKSKILKLLLIISSIFASSSCSYLDKFLGNSINGNQEQTSENDNVPVESLSISPKNLVLEKNEQRTLSATVLPQNATNRNYTWSSDNPLIASVSEYGIVKGLKPGTTNIKAIASDGSGVYDSCSVTVNGINYDYTFDFQDKYFSDDSSSWLCTKPGADFSNGVQIDKDMDTAITSKKEYVGGKKVFVRYHTSSSDSNKEVGHFNLTADIYNQSFSICGVGSKSTVAEFDFDQAFVGKIEFYSCAYENSIFIEGIDILIGDIIYPTSITLSADKTTLRLNESCNIDINYYPLSTTIKKFLFSSSSNPDVIEIDGTKVWATGYGEATVTIVVLGEGDRNKSSTIKFIVPPIKVEGIEVSPKNLSLTVGGQYYIQTLITPLNALDKSCTYKSNNESIATVNNDGLVKAVAIGTTTIEVKTNDGGFVDYCTVTVEKVKITSITLNYTTLDMYIGDTISLIATISPSDVADQTIKFRSENNSVATVDMNGSIKAVGEGTTVIEVKSNDGNVTATCTITVKKSSVTGINFNYSNITIGVGDTAKLASTITPLNATDKSVTYLSSDESVVTVDKDGVITSLKEGVATIEVKTNDGDFTSNCEVSVIQKSEINENQQELNKFNYYEDSYCPSFGNPRLLVIPVWFNDSSSYIKLEKRDDVRTDIEKAFFGSEEDVGWESVSSYYEELSNNKVHLQGTVTDWYECNKDSSKISNYVLSEILANNAADYYFSTHQEDSPSNYDFDKDGYIDGVIVIYAVPDNSSKPDLNDNYWAYVTWRTSNEPNVARPQVNPIMWASYDFMYDKKTSFLRTGFRYGYGVNDHCIIDTHTYIHEMGHMFGLEDYYDYTNTSRPAGGFSMQDFAIGSHDPFSVLQLGWTNPYIPVETQTIYLRPFQSSKDVILLTPSWNDAGSVFDEYFLLEFYTPTGLNELDSTYGYSSPSEKGPDELGIRLWHVDARLAYYDNYSFSGPYVGINNHSCGFAFNNNAYRSGESSYMSVLGSDYGNDNLLQLIRNNSNSTYLNNNMISNSDLFSDGSTFSMDTFASQFVNSGKLNSNIDLGWTFSVSISGNGEDAIASVTCTKLD